jgi:histidine triad (HIT) family protein
MYKVIPEITKELEISEEGYRIVGNCNKNGGQEVYHIHLHIMGGRKFQWPAG